MAKKNTTKTEGEQAGAPSEAKAEVLKGAADRLKFVGRPEGKKLPPQAKAIVDILEAAGTDGLTRKDLVAAMDGKVTTRQPQSRILSYYQKLLVEEGFVAVSQEAAA